MDVCKECLTRQQIRNLDAVLSFKLHVVKCVLRDIDGSVERLVGEVGYYKNCILSVGTHECVLAVRVEIR